MSNTGQGVLFGPTAPALAGAVSQARRGARGRGATGRMELALPGGNAGCVVRFCFRPLHRHCRPLAGDGRPVWRVACDLLAVYAAAVGGFRLARDRVVRAWADVLADFTPDEVRLAIARKAASLAAGTPEECDAKRRFIGRPERFPRLLAAWLALSAEYERRRNAADAPAAERLRQRLSELRPRALQGAVGVQGDVSDAGDQRPQRGQFDRWAHWRQLGDSRRAAAMTATRRLFVDRCQAWGLDPNGEESAAVRLGFAADWAARQWPLGAAQELCLEAARP